jgi:hypothetical protein
MMLCELLMPMSVSGADADADADEAVPMPMVRLSKIVASVYRSVGGEDSV